MVEVKYKVNLQQDVLTSELAITNSKTSSIRVTGSVVTHLTISTPDATYVIGLEGSNFFNRPPFLSNYSIIPPNWSQDKGRGYNQLWGQTSLNKFLSNWVVSEANEEDSTIGKEVEGEESDNYKHLTEEMSNIYTNAPRNFTIIDRVITFKRVHIHFLFLNTCWCMDNKSTFYLNLAYLDIGKVN